MAWTKKQLIAEAFAECALAGHVFDIDPEEDQAALRRMDSMVAAWEAKGIRIGYALGDDINAGSGIPDGAAEAVYLNLAIRLAPGYGKTVTAETRQAAKSGYDALLRAAAFPPEQQFGNTLPIGAGNKPWRTSGRVYMPTPDHSPIQPTSGGDLDIAE